MRSGSPKALKFILLLIACSGLVGLLSSCRSAWVERLRPGGDPLLHLFTQDHVGVTRSDAAMTLMHYRVRPSTTVTGKRELAVEECRALALQNNLELQVARLEEITKKAVEYSSRTKLLPHFIFSAELSNRDKVAYSYSDPSGQEGQFPEAGGGGTGVNVWSTGHERSTWRYILETKWSPTDAALAYYLTRSAVNDTTKAYHQRVRVAQKLLGVVDGAFYRILCLQECIPMARRLVDVRADVARTREKGVEKRLESLDDYHKAKKRVVTARRLLASLVNELERQRSILASALGISPEYCVDGGFVLVGPLTEPSYDAKMCELELLAVQNRPEAYQAGLNYLNSENDLKRTIVKYFPNVTGFWRTSHDKDKYIFYKDWNEVGMQVYFDLLDWLANLSESAAVSVAADKTRREIGTVALGITSQVRLAALKYYDSLDELRSSNESLVSSRSLLRVAEDRHALTTLERVMVDEAKADLLQDLIRRIRAVGEAQATLAEVYSTLGTNYNEPLPVAKPR
ncbi:MAG: TolC family protein [Deltaproteobacteria bacterium]|nr:TolC family protein [Deltaproteobacteria bacterium]